MIVYRFTSENTTLRKRNTHRFQFNLWLLYSRPYGLGTDRGKMSSRWWCWEILWNLVSDRDVARRSEGMTCGAGEALTSDWRIPPLTSDPNPAPSAAPPSAGNEIGRMRLRADTIWNNWLPRLWPGPKHIVKSSANANDGSKISLAVEVFEWLLF